MLSPRDGSERVALVRNAARLGLLAAVLAGAGAAPASAAVDIRQSPHLVIAGADQMAGLGDVNADGIPDIGVIATDGSAYVVFGRRTPQIVVLSDLGTRGYRITPETGGTLSGVDRAGDVNADGRADVFVADTGANHNGGYTGSAYVVYGKSGSTPVDLNSLGSGGFRIDGPVGYEYETALEISMDAAGDQNGDGRGDVMVGFREAVNYRIVPGDKGTSFVLYGPGSGVIDTGSALGARGFKILYSGGDVAGLGDFNGDGLPDLATGRANAGDSHVVFGRRPPIDRNADVLGTGGFAIYERDRSTGWAIDGGQDVNGDGRRDLAIGHQQFLCGTWVCFGAPRSAAVIFGGPSTANVDTAAIGTRGFRIVEGDQTFLNGDVALLGDVNGDTRADLGVGWDTNAALVVFGKANNAPVDVGNPGTDGIELTNPGYNDVYNPIVRVGDQTGDGLADVGMVDTINHHAYVVSLAPSAADQLATMAFRVVSFNLAQPLTNQLVDRLTATRKDVLNNNKQAACLRLGEFKQFVSSRQGNGLSNAQTFELVISANRVSAKLGC
jgi:FG-GAP repeat